jgi:hypothetical protein
MERIALIKTRIQVDDTDSGNCGETCTFRRFDQAIRQYRCSLFKERLERTNAQADLKGRRRCQQCLKHFGK